VKEIRSMVEHFKAVPDFRERFESYPLWSMLTIFLLATLCGAPRGQKDIPKFARGLSQAQRRALGIRRNLQGKYPAPTQPTFCRLLQRVDARKVEEIILAMSYQRRPDHFTTTDFQAALSEDHHRPALGLALSKYSYAKKWGLEPIGRLVDNAYAGVGPKYMGIGPVPAVQKLLKKPASVLTVSTCSRSTKLNRYTGVDAKRFRSPQSSRIAFALRGGIRLRRLRSNFSSSSGIPSSRRRRCPIG
jgi:hypothetical protein